VQQTAAAERSNFVLFFLIGTVERSEVDVGRGVIDVLIVVIGSEDAENQGELAGT